MNFGRYTGLRTPIRVALPRAFKSLLYYLGMERGLRTAEANEFPSVVLLDTVSYCNLRCWMCFHKEMERQKGFMPWPLFRKCIDEIAVAHKDTRVWMVFFGEPFIRRRYKPTIFEMIRYAKARRLTDAVVNSNANLLDEATARHVIDQD